MRTLKLSVLLTMLPLMIPAPQAIAAAEVQGTVNDAQVSGSEGTSLDAGSQIQTGDDSRMQIQMNGGQVRFGEQTQAILSDTRNDLDLRTGVMLVSSGQGLGRKDLNIRTPEYKVAAMGTALVGYKPGEYIKVTCIEGTVRIAMPGLVGEFVTLAPGQQLVALATENRLPEPVEVNLKVLTETSGLISSDDLPPLENEERIQESVLTQQNAIANGTLQLTPFFLQDMSLNIQADLDSRLSQAGAAEQAERVNMNSSFQRLNNVDQSESFFAKVGRALRPNFLRDSDTAVFQSPNSVTLTGQQDVTSFANSAGSGSSENSVLIGSQQNLNIGNGSSATITNTRDLNYLEFFAGNDLTLADNSQIEVSASSSETTTDTVNSGEYRTTTETQKQHGLRLFAQNILSIFGDVTNQTGALDVYGTRGVEISGSSLTANQGVRVGSQGNVDIGNSIFSAAGGDMQNITYLSSGFSSGGNEMEVLKFQITSTGGNINVQNSTFTALDNESDVEDVAEIGIQRGPNDGPFTGRNLTLGNLVFENLDTVRMNGDTINVNGPLEFDGAAARFNASNTVNLPNGFAYNGHNFGIKVGVTDSNGNYLSGNGVTVSGANLTAGRTRNDSNYKDITRGDDTNYNDVLIHAGSRSNATLKVNSSTLKVLANSAPDSWVWIAGYGNTSVDISNSNFQNMLSNGGNIEVHTDRNLNVLNSIFQARDAINFSAGENIFMQGNNLSSQTLISIAAGNNLIFSGNNALNAPNVYLSGDTVQVNSGGLVTSNGEIHVTANHKNYNDIYSPYGDMIDKNGPVPGGAP